MHRICRAPGYDMRILCAFEGPVQRNDDCDAEKCDSLVWSVIGGNLNGLATMCTLRNTRRRACTKKKVGLLLIHTRLQPGDRECEENGKPFKTVSSLSLAQFTWLKPGVNEIELAERILRWCERLFVPSREEVFVSGSFQPA